MGQVRHAEQLLDVTVCSVPALECKRKLSQVQLADISLV